MEEALAPDERTFRQHIARARFQLGVDRGDWRMVANEWPHPIIAIAAAQRAGAPDEVALQFTLDGYPAMAPTAEPWDAERDVALAHDLWPDGGRVGVAFNPGWRPNQNARSLYIPMDRLALVGHDQWPQKHKSLIWDPTRMDIVDYLKVIYELLHSSQYSGVRRAA